MPARPVRRSPARWLAPVALVAAALSVGMVAAGSLGGDSSGSATKQRTTTTTSARKSSEPRISVYTVKSGDVLSVIAERYNVPVSRIERLNPDVDPQTLRPGTRLRLRP